MQLTRRSGGTQPDETGPVCLRSTACFASWVDRCTMEIKCLPQGHDRDSITQSYSWEPNGPSLKVTLLLKKFLAKEIYINISPLYLTKAGNMFWQYRCFLKHSELYQNWELSIKKFSTLSFKISNKRFKYAWIRLPVTVRYKQYMCYYLFTNNQWHPLIYIGNKMSKLLLCRYITWL